MAAMTKPRLYHSSTVLLPDGRVLSAGSGRPKATNGGVDQYNCEIFSPPYLFKGARPTITSSPVVANNGVAFTINTPDAASITRVTMVRLSSTTHSFNQDQRFNTLSFTARAGELGARSAGLLHTLHPERDRRAFGGEDAPRGRAGTGGGR